MFKWTTCECGAEYVAGDVCVFCLDEGIARVWKRVLPVINAKRAEFGLPPLEDLT